MVPGLKSSAVFSKNRKYRYTLTRQGWGGTGTVMFIGLNPSTADGLHDDATIRRLIRFTQDWGYDGFIMTNLFAFRATDPRDLRRALNPIGQENDAWLHITASKCQLIVCCWGNHGEYLNRGARVIRQLKNVYRLHCFGLSRDGNPLHPLRLAASTQPKVFKP